MSYKKKIRDITIVEKDGAFGSFFKRFYGESSLEFDFEGISALRKVLSNQKAKLIHIIKSKNPGSIYELSKMLKRDINAVKNDLKLLERFGFIELVSEKSGSRERVKPVIVVDSVQINIKL